MHNVYPYRPLRCHTNAMGVLISKEHFSYIIVHTHTQHVFLTFSKNIALSWRVRNHLWRYTRLVWTAPVSYTYLLALVIYGWNQSSSIRCRFVDWRQKKSFNQNVLVVSTENFEMRWNIYERFSICIYMKTNKNWVNSSYGTSRAEVCLVYIEEIINWNVTWARVMNAGWHK